jgi:hypothetical protein
MARIEQRLASLGLTLPPRMQPVQDVVLPFPWCGYSATRPRIRPRPTRTRWLASPPGGVGTEILDEVMCGVGRTGTIHAWEQDGVTPDIQVVAKGLSGGYQPIGGIPIAGRIVEALADGSGGFLHGQTYQAHLVACAGWR